ncbi:MAG: tRNA (N(6)-L-threonylcarbamoyladenosine(37)-C(2))-methylthiotransferase [Candidatus Paceibacterota bacterium]|jgi:MiaB-like tRNA modifying enzyme|nr:tRNA (N(6)-L-threonylcarbamoyladenosine(37)-C(2))-methylthiotransferase [Candidatus Paceibacterota bacterium]MDD5555584.1 tRNA (N(6)-L-threonylcarbamoyladenosine(37)-C(2))-methylthiotransferase [Candidatus Paceibacterota bacterium]
MKKYHLETFGCKLNQTDSERIKSKLDKEYKQSSLKEADFVVLNTCGVVEKTERKILKKINQFKKTKIIIAAGCLPLISEECQSLAHGVIGPQSIDSVNKVVKQALRRKHIVLLKDKHIKKPIALIKQGSAIIPVAEGCLGQCTYCTARLARKELQSFAVKDILKEIKKALNQGAGEIQLTSQDLAVFGLDRGKQELPELLKEIIKIKKEFKVKLGMMNPGQTKKILKPLLKSYQSNKLYKFIHLPLQSGDNKVLKKMKRNYKAEDFIQISEAFRKKFKDSVLATDIIVGHPHESEEAFNNTIKIIKKTKPDIVHIFKFSRRKGTLDYQLKDWPDRIKKQRSRILTDLFKKINEKRNQDMKGKSFKVLVVEKRGKTFLGRTDSGRAVVLNKGKPGFSVKTRITGARWNYLSGKVV